MRYTECRLTRLASETLLDDINMDTVQFLPNFDGSEYEPAVLPAKVPILLLNGGAGIAVGMATNVPPHNLGELMDACVQMVKGRNDGVEINDAKLLSIVPGPDFPVSLDRLLAALVNHWFWKLSHPSFTLDCRMHHWKIGCKKFVHNGEWRYSYAGSVRPNQMSNLYFILMTLCHF